MDGGLNNFVVPAADNSTSISCGGPGIATGATSDIDGATNTSTIVDCLTNSTGNPDCTGSSIDPSTYTAGLCSTYEARGGFTTGWFLGAEDQLDILYINRVSIGNFTNNDYWSSKEATGNPTGFARRQDFSTGSHGASSKAALRYLRCIRAF